MTAVEEKGALIVTGASRGIGAAIAILAANQGFPVIVNFERSRDAARETTQKIIAAGGHARAVQGNVGREEDVLRIFETTDREFGFVQGLVNNAGVTGGHARVEAIQAADVLEMFG